MPTQAKPELSDPELKTSLGGFFKAVRKLSDDASYRFIADIVDQNAELTKENNRLGNAETVNIAQIIQLGRQLDETNVELREKGDLLVKLQDCERRLDETDRELQKTIQTWKKYEAESRQQEAKALEMKEQLRAYKELAEAQAREMADRLQKIDSWRVPMKKVGKTETERTSVSTPHLLYEANHRGQQYHKATYLLYRGIRAGEGLLRRRRVRPNM